MSLAKNLSMADKIHGHRSWYGTPSTEVMTMQKDFAKLKELVDGCASAKGIVKLLRMLWLTFQAGVFVHYYQGLLAH